MVMCLGVCVRVCVCVRLSVRPFKEDKDIGMYVRS
jgi:hypothetical protein